MQIRVFIRDRSFSYFYREGHLVVEATDAEGNVDNDYIPLAELAEALRPYLNKED